MSKNTIDFADGLPLPASIATETLAIIAVKGAGKTYAAMKLAEGFAAAGQQFVALDPTGVWHGLAAAGTGPALPVLVMGGEHGHVPLEPTAGEVVAEFVVEDARSVVLDLSGMRKAETHRFTAAFLDRLYHAKASRRDPLHVFFDEADTAAPQNPGPEQAKVLGAAEDCVRRGRSRGLGMTLITQRPAVLNKNLLEMCDPLIVLRVVGANDVDAVERRVRVDADRDKAAAMVAELPRLGMGEAYVWSPSALKTFARVKVGPRRTFDSSRTPSAGERRAEPTKRATHDLATLTEKMRATVERAKQNDPKALRAELADLRRQLAAMPAATPEVRTVEKPVVSDAQVRAVESIVARLEREGERRVKAGEELSASGRQLNEKAAEFVAALGRAASPAARQPAAPPPPRPAAAAVKRAVPTGEGAAGLGKCERAILAVLSQYPEGCEAGRLTLLSGYRWTGSFRNSLGALRTAGMIEGDNGGSMRVTEAGLAAGPFPALPTGGELVDYWLNNPRFGLCERKILGALVGRPEGMDADKLCGATGYGWTGSFRNALGALRTAGVLVGRNNETMRASDELVEAAALG